MQDIHAYVYVYEYSYICTIIYSINISLTMWNGAIMTEIITKYLDAMRLILHIYFNRYHLEIIFYSWLFIDDSEKICQM